MPGAVGAVLPGLLRRILAALPVALALAAVVLAMIAAAAAGALGIGAAPPSPRPGLGALSVVIDTGRVTQHFGEHPEIYGPGGHTGVDIGAPAGTVVRAAGAGEAHPLVSLDGGGAYSGYGIYVLIVHSPVFTTLYAHLSAQLVSEGERVAQGDPVGLVGSTGWSTGPHLHFELRFYGRVVDPEIWLSMFLGLAQSPPAELSAFNGAPAPLSRTVN